MPEAVPCMRAGNLCATWLIKIEKLPAPAPKAIITPMVSVMPHCVGISGTSAQPKASSSVPLQSTGQAP